MDNKIVPFKIGDKIRRRGESAVGTVVEVSEDLVESTWKYKVLYGEWLGAVLPSGKDLRPLVLEGRVRTLYQVGVVSNEDPTRFK